MSLRTIKAGETSVPRRQVFFDIRLEADGITPALAEAGGQPQISIAGAAWTSVGISTLTSVGNGRYYAILDVATVSVAGVSVETRYKSGVTAETPGDTTTVQQFNLADIVATQDEILETLELSNGALTGGGGSGITATYYGSLLEANNYFDMRLHETAWTGADVADRPKALWAATQIIDTLNYKGQKAAVYSLLLANPNATTAQLRDAEASQPMEFPRGSDTSVPESIRRACYEIAHSLLDGKDPELELENLGIISQGYSSVRTTYQRSQVPIEHLINGVPNALAWRLIRPFLRDGDQLKISRIS
jgi:hypothetical protein